MFGFIQIGLQITGLMMVSTIKLMDLRDTGHWSHTNSNGCTYQCRVIDHMQDYDWMGENLYEGPCSIENAVRLWIKSPTHNKVLRHPYNEIVFLKAQNGDHCYYVLGKGIRSGK